MNKWTWKWKEVENGTRWGSPWKTGTWGWLVGWLTGRCPCWFNTARRVWQVAAMFGQVASTAASASCLLLGHRQLVIPTYHITSSYIFCCSCSSKYICQWCCQRGLSLSLSQSQTQNIALFVLILWHSYKVCLRICAAQYVIAWASRRIARSGERKEKEGESRQRPRLMAMYVQVNTHTCIQHICAYERVTRD